MVLLILGSIILVTVLYSCVSLNKVYHYWSKRGVSNVKPSYIFGNFKDIVLRRKSLFDVVKTIYYSNNNARYIGLYQFLRPILLLKDLDLIKEITVKEFRSFSDHSYENIEEADPYWSKTLIAKSAAHDWNSSRAFLSASFTGKKLRILIPLIQECTHNLINYINSTPGILNTKKIITLEMYDILKRLSNDIVVSVTLGISINSFQDHHNLYYEIGRKTVDFSGLRGFTLLISQNFPKLMKIFKLRIFDRNIVEFYKKVIKDTIKFRKENNIVRPDFLYLLTDDGRDISSKKIDVTTDVILTNCLTFFFGGFETITATLTHLVYELTINVDVQQRLYEEITRKLHSNETLTYESISEMKYLDAVVSETLRLHPPFAMTERKCTKSFTIAPKIPGELPLVIEKNSGILIPIREIHRDPKYFPDPLKFDPDRFSEENKPKIIPSAYIPFGYGPRNCIAGRYSLLKLKIILIEVLRHFEFVRVNKTEVPFPLKVDSLFLTPKNGVWIGVKLRD